MSCECYQIGGRFIAEDPDCEVHCAGGLAERLELAEIEADRRRDDFAERALLNAAKRDELHARAKVVLQKGTPVQKHTLLQDVDRFISQLTF